MSALDRSRAICHCLDWRESCLGRLWYQAYVKSSQWAETYAKLFFSHLFSRSFASTQILIISNKQKILLLLPFPTTRVLSFIIFLFTMMRLLSVALLGAAVLAQDATRFDFADESPKERALQVPDVSDFNFNFGAVNVNQTVAEANCPNEWRGIISCVAIDCSNFQQV
jgi:hypothetical protein